jgi:hypothetical protein
MIPIANSPITLIINLGIFMGYLTARGTVKAIININDG